MTIDNELKQQYSEWLRYKAMPYAHSYGNLLQALIDTDFRPSMDRDTNRSADGIYLRTLFAIECNYSVNDVNAIIDDNCSLMEMMLALAIRMEDSIMSDPEIGDRTSHWFASMLYSLNVMQPDENFDINWFRQCIYEFNTRQYQPNGFGGLFTIRDPHKDMRTMEIWAQMNQYLVEVDRNSEHINL